MKKMMTRALAVAAIVLTLNTPTLPAQVIGSAFQWYLGAQGGVMVFETPRQERTGIPMIGGNVLVTARRTALMLSVEEGLGSTEQTSYIDPSAAAGVRNVSFNDIRKYSAILMVYPVKSSAQPFVGVGFGLIHLHNPFPAGPFATPDEQANAKATAQDLGSSGFGTFVAGLQFQLGSVGAFGMYQITTSPTSGHLLEGPTHTLSGGIRVSLGGAREGISGGGY
ncbi:MAG: hypothetical protein AB7I33_08450 [Gemmatimonadales bacterium]